MHRTFPSLPEYPMTSLDNKDKYNQAAEITQHPNTSQLETYSPTEATKLEMPSNFHQFLQQHSSPSMASFNERLLSYSFAFVSIYSAFIIQAAALFPVDGIYGVRLAILGLFVFGQIVLTALSLIKSCSWAYISSFMLALMVGAACTVVVLDKDFGETLADSAYDFGQLPPYLPLLVLAPCCPMFLTLDSTVFLTSHMVPALLYFITHLLTDRTTLTTCFESAILVGHIGNTLRKSRPQFHQLFITFKLIKSLNEAADDSPVRLKTGIEYVLKSLKRVRNCLEIQMDLQSEEIKIVTRELVRSLGEVHQKISETDLYAADSDKFNEIDPEDKQFIEENYMQDPKKSRAEPTTPGIRGLVLKPVKSSDRYDYKDLVSVLSQMGRTWNFNTFMLVNLAESKPIPLAGKYAFIHYNLVERFDISQSTYLSFFDALEAHYKPNPYHNSCHAVDVMNSFMYLSQRSEINQHLTSLETIGSLLACLAHDAGHPGVTNRFLMGSKAAIALRYNDYSVLEMMHSSILFETLQDDGKNVLKCLTDSEWTLLRKQVIEMILATDMSRHFEFLGKFRAMHAELDIEALSKFEVRLEVYKMTLKCADVGHAAKSKELHEHWTSLICEEFFNQGDIERSQGMPISMYCDRLTTDLPKSQFGFIKNLIIPLFEGLNGYLKSPDIERNCIQQLYSNLLLWSDKQPVKKSKIIVGGEVDDQSPKEKRQDYQALRRISTSNLRSN